MRSVPAFTPEQRAELVVHARSFLDVPYRHRGRSMLGMDCIGMVICAVQSVGSEVTDSRAYSPQPDGSTLRRMLVHHLGEPTWTAGDSLDLLQPGDLVSLKWHQHPGHVAIVTDYYLGGLAMIHSWSEAGRVVEHRLSDPWPRRLCEGWRL